MLGKDQRGYVLSGMGLLLLIPVMIIIPIFLAVETQSADLPNKMVISDTSYRAFQDIKSDIRIQVFAFGDAVGKRTYQYTESGNVSSNITKLYSNTIASKYQTVFNNANINISSNFTPSKSVWNSTNGYASKDNGIKISYYNNTGLYPDFDNHLSMNYTISIQSDMIITVDIGNGINGHSQPYAETYSYFFTVNSGSTDNVTANDNLNTFFKNIVT